MLKREKKYSNIITKFTLFLMDYVKGILVNVFDMCDLFYIKSNLIP